MPQIPTVTGPSVEPNRLPTPYRSPATPEGAFGETIGQAAQGVGAALTHLSGAMQQAQDIADDARVNADLAVFHESAINLTDEGLSKQGKNAIGSADETQAKLVESAKAFSQNLANDRQRNRFLPRVREIVSSSHVAAMRHERKQTEEFNDQSAIARIAAAGEAAAKYRTQPEVVASSIIQAEDAVMTRAKANGWSEEVTAEQKAIARSGVYSSALQAMVSQNEHAMFIDAYQKVEGQLTAKDHAQFAKVYAATSDLVEEQATVQTIIDKHPDDFSAAIGEARATLSGKKEEDAIKAIKVRFDERAAIRTEGQRLVTDKAWKAFEAGGERVSAIPRDVFVEFEAFNGEGVARMKQIEEANANKTISPADVDPKVFGDWISHDWEWKTDPKNRPEFLKGQVTNEDMHYMQKQVEDGLNLKRGLTLSGTTPRGPQQDTQSVQGMVATTFLDNPELFIARSPLQDDIDDASRRKGAFTRYVRDRVDGYQKANKGQNPDRETVQKYIDDGLIEGARPGRFWGTNPVRRFEAQTGDTFPPVAAETIPDEERAKIVDMMTRKQLPITDDAILYWWKRKQAGP